MDKLSKQEYELLIDLATTKRESLRQESYSNKETRNQFDDLAMILIKLDAQSKKVGIA